MWLQFLVTLLSLHFIKVYDNNATYKSLHQNLLSGLQISIKNKVSTGFSVPHPEHIRPTENLKEAVSDFAREFSLDRMKGVIALLRSEHVKNTR